MTGSGRKLREVSVSCQYVLVRNASALHSAICILQPTAVVSGSQLSITRGREKITRGICQLSARFGSKRLSIAFCILHSATHSSSS